MVRTLDFHSKNVGSNPASPTLLFKYNLKKKNYLNKMRFGVSFVSLINPFFLTNISYDNYIKPIRFNKNAKIYVKQSYMILTWFYYISFLEKKNKTNKIRFFIAKKKKKKFTITKAPIAHKNWSKEQIMYSFFKFKILFSFNFKKSLFNRPFSISNVDSAFYFLFIIKNQYNPPETNLLLCKRASVYLALKDSLFFTYKQ